MKKSKKILLSIFRQYERKKDTLSAGARHQIKENLLDLQHALLEKDREKASEKAHQLLGTSQLHLKRSFFQQSREFVLGIGMALVVAVLVRQTWFELYEIPTGSMRPTFKEQDRLSVSKTDFGVNIPLTTKHAYFNPDLVQRSSIVIFTVEDMDFRDPDTVYFYLFPGKKLLVKRLIGKPGDILYFCGGKIWGIDKDGNDISSEFQRPELEKIDHIPFIHFEGKMVTTPSSTPGVSSPVILYQMNEPIARLYAASRSTARGELLPKVTAQDPSIRYDNLWGFEHFATARLLTKDQVRQLAAADASTLPQAPLYLELKHHPSLTDVRIGVDEWNRMRPMLGLSTSIIPLKEHHLQAILNNLYTSRFTVKNGFGYRMGADPSRMSSNAFAPHLQGIPDGTYEFYYGKAHCVKWQGVTLELPESHPFYRLDPQKIQLLFNIGMEFDTRFNPQSRDQTLTPSRYAYFRDGDLYLMGAPILKKDDPILKTFIESELKKEKSSHGYHPYHAFIDRGFPLLPDGRINADLIRRYGLQVPPKSYLVLGDNHANSGDSREFGFVPEGNLRGGPVFIFWPPGGRFGTPNHPGYPFLNPGRLVVWALAAIGFGGWSLYQRRRNRLPLNLK